MNCKKIFQSLCIFFGVYLFLATNAVYADSASETTIPAVPTEAVEPDILLYGLLILLSVLVVGLCFINIALWRNWGRTQKQMRKKSDDAFAKIYDNIVDIKMKIDNIYKAIGNLDKTRADTEPLAMGGSRLSGMGIAGRGGYGQPNGAGSRLDGDGSFAGTVVPENVPADGRPKRKSELFLERYNMVLAQEITHKEFLNEYYPESYMMSTMDAYRKVSFVESDSAGKIQVFSQLLGEDQNQIAVLNAREISSLNNQQTRTMLENAFEFTGVAEFSDKRLVCVSPARVRKISPNGYEIVAKGVYRSF